MDVVEFVESRFFTKTFGGDASHDSVFRELQRILIQDPERGDLIRGTGGIRKVRVPDAKRGIGKSGGWRIIYYLVTRTMRIYLLAAYPKSTKIDLTAREKSGLAAMVRVLDAEERRAK